MKIPNPFSLILVFLLSQFALYSTDDDVFQPNPNCPPFDCGNLEEKVGYPFSNITNHECGLYAINCTEPTPVIDFNLGGKRYYEVKKLFNHNNTILVHDQILQEGLYSKNCDFLNNFSLPFSTLVSFELKHPNLTLFKCSKNIDFPLPAHFDGFRTYDGCKDYALYYGYRQQQQPSAPLPPCSVVQIPLSETPPDFNASDLFTLLGADFTLEWHVLNITSIDTSNNEPGPFYTNDTAGFVSIGREFVSNRQKTAIVIGIAAGVTGVIVASLMMIIICCCCIRRKYSLHSHSKTFWRKKFNENGHQNMEVFFKNCGSLAPKRYMFSDVKKMTNSFEQKLGEGGFGAVFKGRLHDGMLVAVKVLFSKSERDGEDFINEVASISRTSHVNIVTLHGYCFEKKKMALVYEYMPNGSLEKFIYNKAQSDQLGWEKVYQISIGIARGLEYLHRGCNTQILHFDIKPHNVLLDQDYCPKISDFGLAKLCLRKESMVSILCARGTAGYIAPELFSRNFGRVSYKSDVYSYGMMILEMVGGRKNIDVNVGMDHSSQLYFPHWIYERLERNEDLELHGVLTEEREELARKMIIVGLWCIQTNPLSRPSMSKVLEMLEGTLEALRIPPKPMMFSSPAQSPPVSSSTIVSALQMQPEPILSSLTESTSVSSSTIVSIS